MTDMFIRTVKARSRKGEKHEYLRLVETYRDSGRTRQRVVMSLGRIDLLAPHLDSLVRVPRTPPIVISRCVVPPYNQMRRLAGEVCW